MIKGTKDHGKNIVSAHLTYSGSMYQHFLNSILCKRLTLYLVSVINGVNILQAKEALDMKIKSSTLIRAIYLSVAVYSYPHTDPPRGIGV